MLAVLMAMLAQAATAAPATPPPTIPAPPPELPPPWVAEMRAQPKAAYVGPPAPDPALVAVGDCVWDKVAQLNPGKATPASSGTFLGYEMGWSGPHVSLAAPVMDALKACDPRVASHFHYARYSVYAAAMRRSTPELLAKVRIDNARIDKAWAQAPAELREGAQDAVERLLDGEGGGYKADWMPLFRAVGLGQAPKPPLKGAPLALASITPEQAAVRDYVMGVELAAALQERMARPVTTSAPVPAGVWALDTPMNGEDMADYYPDAARDAGKSGHAAVRCRITDLGQLADCEALAETPAGMGFARATLQVARRMAAFRIDPKGVTGPKAGATYILVIAWRLAAE